jgi:hypothetical protein
MFRLVNFTQNNGFYNSYTSYSDGKEIEEEFCKLVFDKNIKRSSYYIMKGEGDEWKTLGQASCVKNTSNQKMRKIVYTIGESVTIDVQKNNVQHIFKELFTSNICSKIELNYDGIYLVYKTN